MATEKCYYRGVWVAKNSELFSVLEDLKAEKKKKKPDADVVGTLKARADAIFDAAEDEYHKYFPVENKQ
jgi:hypothetical protein